MKNLRENERGKNCGDFGSLFIKIEKKLWPGDHIQCGDFLKLGPKQLILAKNEG